MAQSEKVLMKRHEYWRMQYRNRRYMKHLPEQALKQRLTDVLSNLTVLNLKGQISLHDRQVGGEYWMTMWTHILEECGLRGQGLPIGRSLGKIRLPNATAPEPPKSAWVCELLLKELNGTAYLVKYGKAEHLQEAFETGRWKISAASSYDDPSLNSARRDHELERVVELMPEEVKLEVFDEVTGKIKGRINPLGNVVLRTSTTDYYVCCLSSQLHVQLFDDFDDADCCIVIRDPVRFAERLFEAVEKALPEFDGGFSLVKYLDPLNTQPESVRVPFTKHFRYWYQHEARFVWYPESLSAPLQRDVFVSTGSMKDIAVFVQP